MIFGPFSEEFFWFDESNSDPEFFDHWNDTYSTQSSDDWDWDEWGDLVLFRPTGLEQRYPYPLVVWLSNDAVAGTTLRDWFPDLSDRNYIGVEIRRSAPTDPQEIADRVAVAIREIQSAYNIHRQRIWIAGTGTAADCVVEILPSLESILNGAIVLAPSVSTLSTLKEFSSTTDLAFYVGVTSEAVSIASETLPLWGDVTEGVSRLVEWESISGDRVKICGDLNQWLMQQICTPAGHDSGE